MLKFFISKKRSKQTNYQKTITEFLHSNLGIHTKNIELYEIALTHKSFYANTASKMKNNERLEFLGDAILSAIVTHILYTKFPQKTEGELTQIRARIVSRENLNLLGKTIGLETHIQYQKTKNEYLSLIGNTFESLIGAIYLDKGYEKVHTIIEKRIFDLYLNYESIESLNEDYKSQLIIYCQKNKRQVHFITENETPEEGRVKFTIAITLDNYKIAQADAYSKRKAEQTASQIALQKLALLAEMQNNIIDPNL